MSQVGMHEAKTKLSQLVERAQAGEDVVITRQPPPAPVPARAGRADSPSLSSMRAASGGGQVHIADDFDELPDDIAEAFGMR